MIELSPEWKMFIEGELAKDYMVELKKKVLERRKSVNVYPPSDMTFSAFVHCPYNDLKVVILGQDPYHSPGDAHGLAFSSWQPRTPPSLKNIFDEIFNDYFSGNTGGINVFQHNDLSQWAWQGVLLLNTILTVDEGNARSHAGFGWEYFAENAIKFINLHKSKLVFMLWGKDAKRYKDLINGSRHLILESDHPAAAFHNPKSWFGNKHFSKANNFIKDNYFNIKMPINWGVYNNPNHIVHKS